MKTPNIKFNLKFYDANGGEEVVRTLDDLREKCNLSDLYDYYESGVLGRWLTSIGQVTLAKQLPTSGAGDDLRKTIQTVLRILGIVVEEQNISDFLHTQIRKGLAGSSGCSVRDEHTGIPSFMVLMSPIFEIGRGVKSSMSVEDMQKIEDKTLPYIRQLIKFHELAFMQSIERCLECQDRLHNLPGSGLWWILLLLYSNEKLRGYVQFYLRCCIDWGFSGYSNKWNVPYDTLRVDVYINERRVHAGTVTMSSDQANKCSTEEFCNEKFGWTL